MTNAICVVVIKLGRRRLRRVLRARLTLGRGDDCDLIVPSSLVSRHHVTLACGGGAYTIQDTGSRNGTWIGGQRVSGRQPLPGRQRVTLGEAVLVCVPGVRVVEAMEVHAGSGAWRGGLVFRCGACQAKLGAALKDVGALRRCSRCRGRLIVPAPDWQAPPAEGLAHTGSPSPAAHDQAAPPGAVAAVPQRHRSRERAASRRVNDSWVRPVFAARDTPAGALPAPDGDGAANAARRNAVADASTCANALSCCLQTPLAASVAMPPPAPGRYQPPSLTAFTPPVRDAARATARLAATLEPRPARAALPAPRLIAAPQVHNAAGLAPAFSTPVGAQDFTVARTWRATDRRTAASRSTAGAAPRTARHAEARIQTAQRGPRMRALSGLARDNPDAGAPASPRALDRPRWAPLVLPRVDQPVTLAQDCGTAGVSHDQPAPARLLESAAPRTAHAGGAAPERRAQPPAAPPRASLLQRLRPAWRFRLRRRARFPRGPGLLRRARDIVRVQPRLAVFTDAELRGQMAGLRIVFRLGRASDDHVDVGLALITQAARRVSGRYPLDVQIAAALALEAGALAELPLGEAKTTAVALAATLAGWRGRGCHVVAWNQYLAERDAELGGLIYRFCGLAVAVVDPQMTLAGRREAYSADVTYTTAAQLLTDLQHDRQMVRTLRRAGPLLRRRLDRETRGSVLRGLRCTIVNEADAQLLDAGAGAPAAIAQFRQLLPLYGKRAGILDAAGASAGGLQRQAELPVIRIPLPRGLRARPQVRLFTTDVLRWQAVLEQIQRLRARQQPVWVCVPDGTAVLRLGELLESADFAYQMLSGAGDAAEAEAVAHAGRAGRITIVPPGAGRGTDVHLSPTVHRAGGLHVILVAPSPRQYDDDRECARAPGSASGSATLFASLDDPVLRRLSAPTRTLLHCLSNRDGQIQRWIAPWALARAR